jgi:putative inorganic carbon (HCO3(-)) transporter
VRDLVVTMIVGVIVLYAVMRPSIGVLGWTWLSYMNPHRLTWGFAFHFPFVQVMAIATFIGMLFSRERLRMVWSPLTIVWLLWVGWMSFTTLFAMNEVDAVPEWQRAMKIQAMVLVTLLVMGEQRNIHRLVWVVALSIGFFGIKGGIFTIATGGNYLVWGPWETFITGNNEMALALLTVLPLFRYMQVTAENKWVKRAMLAAMILCGAAILGSWSRGALLGGAAMFFVLWLKTRRKWLTGALLVVCAIAFLSFLPEGWFERMGTIKDYEEDRSAMGRINAWGFAVAVANDHPMVGGGFRAFTPELFLQYAPEPNEFHDAHSIYFEVLGEHGYVGLMLFLLLAFLSFRTCQKIVRKVKGRADLAWAGELAAMVQVSLIGFGVGGAFLGLAYFDLPYTLMALSALTNAEVDKALKAGVPTPVAAGPPAAGEQTPAQGAALQPGVGIPSKSGV